MENTLPILIEQEQEQEQNTVHYNFNKPYWDKRPYSDRIEYQNLNNTGSRLFDLLIHASGSYNGIHALWIGFKERDDNILSEEVQQLIENGESVLQILDSEPYFLGCFPSRVYPSAKFTPLTYCMSQRMPVVASKIVDLCTKEELELLAPLPMAVKCYSRYIGQKNEYKNLIKKMVQKLYKCNKKETIQRTNDLILLKE